MASSAEPMDIPVKSELNPKTGIWLMAILGALMAFTSLSTDIYLPAMPQMAKDLQGNVELTITGFLIGFMIAQLIWGPISDHLGRRIPLFIGMILFVIGSVGCALSDNLAQIVFWRVFQAFGACTGPMLARAMIRDLFSRTEGARMLSTLVIIMAIAPIFGPVLGGQIILFSTWHSIFWLLALIGCLMFISLFWLPETLAPEKRMKATFQTVSTNYLRLLTNVSFMKYTLCVTFYYVAAYAFITGSPAIYISYFGVEPQYYGWLFALNIVGVMSLSFVNRSLVRRFSLQRLLKTSSLVSAIAMISMAVVVRMDVEGIIVMLVMIFIFFSMNGVIAASSTAAALDEVPEIAGSASALIGALQYGSGIISSLLLAYFGNQTPWTMTWIMLLFTCSSALVVRIKSVEKA